MFNPRENVPLSSFSNYKIGGPARYFSEVKAESELKEAILWAKDNRQPIFILGGGTNLLISDAGFSGLVVKPNLLDLSQDGLELEVGAGVLIENLLNYCIERSLAGFEWAGGLPGTFGGAVRGNAGAFGGETKDSIVNVTSFNTETLTSHTLNFDDCHFGYRTSLFKEKNGEEVILKAKLRLKSGDQLSIQNSIQEKVNYRKERQPLEYPNIGSIFKNVDTKLVPAEHLPFFQAVIKVDPFPVVPAAHLLSEVGLKGATRGGAAISPKHPNFIINTGGATAADVLALINLAKTKVKDKYGILLEEEVQLV